MRTSAAVYLEESRTGSCLAGNWKQINSPSPVIGKKEKKNTAYARLGIKMILTRLAEQVNHLNALQNKIIIIIYSKNTFFSASASSNAFCASSTIPCSPEEVMNFMDHILKKTNKKISWTEER